MKLPWGKIAQYAIPVATALLGAGGGYVGHSAISTPAPETKTYSFSCPPVDFSKVDLSRLKIPSCPPAPKCPDITIPRCPDLQINGVRR